MKDVKDAGLLPTGMSGRIEMLRLEEVEAMAGCDAGAEVLRLGGEADRGGAGLFAEHREAGAPRAAGAR
jgi:hypothetical protein